MLPSVYLIGFHSRRNIMIRYGANEFGRQMHFAISRRAVILGVKVGLRCSPYVGRSPWSAGVCGIIDRNPHRMTAPFICCPVRTR